MGQYWIPVNLDKREYIHPHNLGGGLKLAEQLGTYPGTGAALIILCAAMPETRGGGDLDLEENWHGPERKFPEHNTKPGPMPEAYRVVAQRTIGRWAGDRIALVGDYAEAEDLPSVHQANLIFSLCESPDEIADRIFCLRERARKGDNDATLAADALAAAEPYRDISDDVCAVIEHELGGHFEGKGWRQWQEGSEEQNVPTM